MRNIYKEALEKQLAIDYACTIEEVQSADNVYTELKKTSDMRPIGTEKSLLKLAVYNEKLLIMASPQIMEWCREHFGNKRGTWLAEPESLIQIHNKLSEYGQKLADTHHHYIPRDNYPLVEKRFEIRVYEELEIEIFRGDKRFWEALLFDETTPDMLAVCAVEGENILGMASATRDSEVLWQIGVNVTEEGRGRGVGTYVTAILKEKLLERGIVPTYATVESHIKSQKVALEAGFEPAFYELFSE